MDAFALHETRSCTSSRARTDLRHQRLPVECPNFLLLTPWLTHTSSIVLKPVLVCKIARSENAFDSCNSRSLGARGPFPIFRRTQPDVSKDRTWRPSTMPMSPSLNRTWSKVLSDSRGRSTPWKLCLFSNDSLISRRVLVVIPWSGVASRSNGWHYYHSSTCL